MRFHIPKGEISSVLDFFLSNYIKKNCSKVCSDHFFMKNNAINFFRCGFNWPTLFKDIKLFIIHVKDAKNWVH